MKKMKPSVKAALAPTLVLASTAAIAYAVPGMTNEKTTDSSEKLKLEVQRVDSDTVKVSIDNVQDIPKSLQFSIKLDGVTLQDGENSIHDLVEKELKERLSSDQDSASDSQVLTDYTYNEAENTIDVLITATESLPKIGNKIEVFELDVKKADDDDSNSYKVIPTQDEEYKYVSLTNKEYSTSNVVYENEEILMTIAPTIFSTEQYVTVTEGETLTADDLKEKLGLVLNHEDGDDNLNLEITKDGEVIGEFKEEMSGLYTLTLTAVKDGTLKSEAIEVQVNVILDNVTEAPTITKDNQELADITLNGGETFVPLQNVKAVDAKGREVEVSVKVDQALDLDPEQDTDYVLTYTATDIYGNTATKEIKLTVLANQAPVISGVEDTSIKVGDQFDPEAGVTVTDDKDKDLELNIEGEVNTKIPGTYKLSYSVTDSGGKTTRAQRTVTVKQTVATMNSVPVIIAKNITIKVGDEFNPLDGVIAYDREDKDLTASVKVAINEVDRFTPGTYRLVYQVTDSAGATAKKEITVTVLPKMTALNSIPTITASDKTITVGTEFDPLEVVTANDKEDGNLTNQIKVVENEVNIYRVGKYYVTYQVTDSQGATATKTIAVNVNPKPSVINAIPIIDAVDQVIKVGDEFNPLQFVKAYDLEDLDLTHKVEVIENNVDTTKPGEYTVTYSVTDSGGATRTKTITVTVLMALVPMNTAPQILATDLVISVGSTFNAKENVVAYDKEDLDITHKLEVVENNVDTKTPGEYTVTYRVTDSGGATTTKVITVTVKSDVVLATSITIDNKEDNKVYVNGNKTITATVNDEADIKVIDWTISDPSIAELRIVRNEARIIAKATGEVTLTATTTDGSQLTDTITLQVTNFEEDNTVPTYVKEMIDTTVLTPLSGSGAQESPLELEVNDIAAEELDAFLQQLSAINYELIEISEDEEFITYHLQVANKVSWFRLFTSKEQTYINIKVSKYLESASEINEKLGQLVNNNQTPDVDTPDVDTPENSTNEKTEAGTKPSTGYTTILGYIGVATTAIGGALLHKRKKKE